MIKAHGSCLIEARGSRLIGAYGYGSCLIGARELRRSVLVLVTEMVWIGVCDQDGVDLD